MAIADGADADSTLFVDTSSDAIAARYGADVRLIDSRITGNIGGYAPAIGVEGSLAVVRSTIDNHLAFSGPSAVLVDGALKVENGTVTRNETLFEAKTAGRPRRATRARSCSTPKAGTSPAASCTRATSTTIPATA